MKFSRVHAVCAMLRGKPCEQCPRRETIDGYGPCVRGCRVHAEEVVNIVKHGYPWPPPHNARQKAWRKRWNRKTVIECVATDPTPEVTK